MFKKLLAASVAILASGLIAIAASNMTLDGAMNVGKVAGIGTIPVLSTCGTSPAIATGSTNMAGKITVGTSASNACTLTFNTASAPWVTAPVCVVQNLTTGAGANVYAVTSTTIIWSSALADSTVLHYICMGLQGG